MATFETLTVKFEADKRGFDRGAQSVERSLAGITRTAKAMGAALAAAIGVQGVRGMAAFVREGGKAVNVAQAFERATRGQTQALQQLQAATAGTVSKQELMVQFNRALALGAVSNAREFSMLAETARTLGRALGVDTAFAVESLSLGIGRQSRLILDNLGIIVDAEEANKRYAASLGKTTEQLTQAERAEAFRAAALESARKKIEELGATSETNADKLQRIATTFKDIATNIAAAVAESRLFGAVLDALNTSFGSPRGPNLSAIAGITDVGDARTQLQARTDLLRSTIASGGIDSPASQRLIVEIGALRQRIEELTRVASSPAVAARMVPTLSAQTLVAASRNPMGPLANYFRSDFEAFANRPRNLLPFGMTLRPQAPGSPGVGGGGEGFFSGLKSGLGQMFDPKNIVTGMGMGIGSQMLGMFTNGIKSLVGEIFGLGDGMSALERAIRDNTRVLQFVSGERFGQELGASGLGASAAALAPAVQRFMEDMILGNIDVKRMILGSGGQDMLRGILGEQGYNDFQAIANALGIDVSRITPEVLSQWLSAVDSGTDNLHGLADAASRVTEALLNVPKGFKVALARFQVSDPTMTPLSPPVSGGGGGTTIIVETMTVTANNPRELANQLAVEQQRLSRRGTTLMTSTIDQQRARAF